MIFWIVLILMVLGIDLIIAVSEISDKYSHSNEDNNKIVEYLHYNDEPFIFTGGAVAVISGIVSFVMLSIRERISSYGKRIHC